MPTHADIHHSNLCDPKIEGVVAETAGIRWTWTCAEVYEWPEELRRGKEHLSAQLRLFAERCQKISGFQAGILRLNKSQSFRSHLTCELSGSN
jgi:hypothetical protein